MNRTFYFHLPLSLPRSTNPLILCFPWVIMEQDDMPMTIQTPRIAIRDTTIDGIFDTPAKANWVRFGARGFAVHALSIDCWSISDI